MKVSKIQNVLIPAVKAKVPLLVVFFRARWLAVQILLLTLLIGVLLWLSIFLYGAFYYTYMPTVMHERPVYFKLRADCERDDKRCSFPSANISLVKNNKEILVSGQPYIVKLELEMPESYSNQQLGMFMVQLEFYTHHGDIVFTTARPAMMIFKSFIYRNLETLVYFFPSLFFRTRLQRQLLNVELSDGFYADPYRPPIGVVLELQTKGVEIYTALLQIHARFTGLRYLLYYWPTLSAICGITTNFCFLLITSLFFWCSFVVGSASGQRHVITTSPPPDSGNEMKREDLEIAAGTSAGEGSVCSAGSGDTSKSSVRQRTAVKLREAD